MLIIDQRRFNFRFNFSFAPPPQPFFFRANLTCKIVEFQNFKSKKKKINCVYFYSSNRRSQSLIFKQKPSLMIYLPRYFFLMTKNDRISANIRVAILVVTYCCILYFFKFWIMSSLNVAYIPPPIMGLSSILIFTFGAFCYFLGRFSFIVSDYTFLKCEATVTIFQFFIILLIFFQYSIFFVIISVFFLCVKTLWYSLHDCYIERFFFS